MQGSHPCRPGPASRSDAQSTPRRSIGRPLAARLQIHADLVTAFAAPGVAQRRLANVIDVHYTPNLVGTDDGLAVVHRLTELFGYDGDVFGGSR